MNPGSSVLLMLLDFDPEVTAIAAQPFWLHWRDDAGRSRRHAPDLFARMADGSAAVIDVRPDDRIEPRDAEAFEVTRKACELAGWRFRRVGVPDPVRTANVAWLARYRHQRCGSLDVARLLLKAFAEPAPLMAGAAAAGDPRRGRGLRPHPRSPHQLRRHHPRPRTVAHPPRPAHRAPPHPRPVDQLNTTRTRYPGTDLLLIYEVKPHQSPA
jgi:hypothetical protein